MRSVPLRREPTVRQIETILHRIEEELATRGARTERTGGTGGLRFRMPKFWQTPRLGVLLFITSGRAVVSAGAGGPWKVRYQLDFSLLVWIAVVLSVALIGVGLSWPDRSSLLNGLIILWLVVYGIPYGVATARFRRIIQESTHDVIERRRAPRTSGSQPAVDPTSVAEPPPGGVDHGITE